MNLKTLVLIALVSFLFILPSNAQVKIKKFCTLTYYSQDLHTPHIDYGQRRKYSPLKDSAFVHKMEHVESLSNFVQAMNYLTGLGWNYEGNIPTNQSDGNEVVILFSREFNPAELTEGQ
ncbi:hypothetical protein [Pedobacter cryoconitis]|uniref:Uncharacterized protein n=1 Tax=Pedobacter cryoconitis TaxID=188932 RepID=A0A327SJA6_9SPHI|nr:hypothetical protein [Pedobacter cryoconitis]RAJ28572.1 hypothetical protein LY11_03223 [Pedobacter cryoconitis]